MKSAGKARYTRVQMFVAIIGAVLTTAVVAGGLAIAGASTTPNKYYACNKNGVVAGAIHVNKAPTCPSGQKVVLWNQLGPKGATGAAGTKGATGATGPQGPGGLPQLGTLTPTQIVAGAVLTCTSATNTVCNSPLLNGLHISYGGSVATVNEICAVVRGTGFSGASSAAPVTDTYFSWDNVNSKWVIATGDENPLVTFQCS